MDRIRNIPALTRAECDLLRLESGIKQRQLEAACVKDVLRQLASEGIS